MCNRIKSVNFFFFFFANEKNAFYVLLFFFLFFRQYFCCFLSFIALAVLVGYCPCSERCQRLYCIISPDNAVLVLVVVFFYFHIMVTISQRFQYPVVQFQYLFLNIFPLYLCFSIIHFNCICNSFQCNYNNFPSKSWWTMVPKKMENERKFSFKGNWNMVIVIYSFYESICLNIVIALLLKGKGIFFSLNFVLPAFRAVIFFF